MKKDILIPVTAVFLMSAFIVVSALVYLTKGNKKFIKAKLKIGAAILAITSFTIGGCGSGTRTCYEAPRAQQDSISNDSLDGSENSANDSMEKKDSIIKKNDTLQIRSCYKPPASCYNRIDTSNTSGVKDTEPPPSCYVNISPEDTDKHKQQNN